MKKPNPSELNRHGKVFERMVDDAFNPLDKQYPITWERVIDSAAAGNIVAAVEGDFRLKIKSENPGRPYHFVIECKASTQESSFNRNFRSLIKKGQFPLMRMSVRAGAIGLFLFHAVDNDDVELWDFAQLKEPYYDKRKPFNGQPRYIIGRKNLPAFAEKVVTRPKAFVTDILLYR